MTYTEYKEQEQQAFNNLPIFWAFGKNQFKEAMEQRGLTEKDTDKIYSFGGGGYYLRSDAEKIRAFINRPDRLHDMMEQDSEFAETAFYYEMGNHEYHINWEGDWNVCDCFGRCEYEEDKTGVDYLREMGYSDNVIIAYYNARQRFLKDADEKGWY